MPETIRGPREAGKLRQNNEIRGATQGIVPVTGITALPVFEA